MTPHDPLDQIARLTERVRELERELALRPPAGWTGTERSREWVQAVQLELIRRTSFNMFDGERVHRDLVERRGEWSAVLLDRLPSRSDLIKLRDLPLGSWNADTLCVLARSLGDAHELEELGRDHWSADHVEVYGEEASAQALGTSRPEGTVVTLWWD